MLTPQAKLWHKNEHKKESSELSKYNCIKLYVFKIACLNNLMTKCSILLRGCTWKLTVLWRWFDLYTITALCCWVALIWTWFFFSLNNWISDDLHSKKVLIWVFLAATSSASIKAEKVGFVYCLPVSQQTSVKPMTLRIVSYVYAQKNLRILSLNVNFVKKRKDNY